MEYLADRAIIRLGGDDRRSFLQGLITQDVDRLNTEPAIFAALLTPQGKILFDFFVAETPDGFLIDCHREAAPALVKRLGLYKLRAKVAIEADDALSVFAGFTESEKDGFIAGFIDPRLSAMGWRGVGAKSGAPGDEYDQRRLKFGVPEFRRDFAADEMFLMDVNYDALNGASYKKGCFVGQEVTSRMKRKGDVRKRTLIAAFDGAAPSKGATVTAGGSSLGEIMSADGDCALALIRLDRWEKAKETGAQTECEGQALHLMVPEYLKQD